MDAMMMRMFGVAFLAGLLFSGPAVAEDLVTGLAVYEVGLDPSKGEGVASISGTMSARLLRECDTYVTEAELEADLTGLDGATLPLIVVSSHAETAKSLSFELTTTLGGMQVDHAAGTATRNDQGISVTLKEPTEREFTLEGDALFPVAMLEAAIAAAKAGETFREFSTFDGTGRGEEVWTVSVLITPVDEDDQDEEDALFAAGLGFEDMARWRMALSYFPPGANGEQTPAFSTSMVVYENGFAQAAVYDLGEVAMQLKLIEFSPIPPKPCP
ncbi:MAG TPA: DUF1849 family protein [Bauldia sp.]|nr:DUF1849 family protein [Bauldia sp.]